MIINKKDKNFSDLKVKIIEKQKTLSPLYSELTADYYSQRPISKGIRFDDISFIYVENEEPIFMFLGAIKKEKKICSLLFFEIPSISVEVQELINKKIEKKIGLKLQEIYERINGQIFYKDFLVNSNISIFSKFLLLKGFKIEFGGSKILDLKKSEKNLKTDVRKSYKSLINWGNRELNKNLITHENINEEKIMQFRDLHAEVSGRETRPIESWIKQLEIIKNNEGFAVFGNYNDNLVSAGFFLFNKFECYYGSSASKRNFFEKPMFHSIMWEAILYSKKIGCQFFDVGEVSLGQEFQNSLTEKELDIEKFKSGFGGLTRLHIKLIK